ncbi:MAG: DNA translocase FtsK [Phycisphaerales bacterium]|nr:DNA translocase FtsK [Phycisphaerales bacterium]
MGSSTRTSRSPKGERSPSIVRRALVLVLLAGWAYVLASMIGFTPGDSAELVFPPNDPVANWCGPFGAGLAFTLFKVIGMAAWVVVIALGLMLLTAAAGMRVTHAPVRVLGVLLMAGALAGLQHLIFPNSGVLPDRAGGLVGTVGCNELASRFGSLGAGIVLLLGAMIGAVCAMDEWLVWLFGWTWRVTRERGVPVAKEGAVVAAKASGGLISRLVAAVDAALERRRAKVRANDIDDDQPEAAKPRRARKAPVVVEVEREEEEEAVDAEATAAPAKRAIEVKRPEPLAAEPVVEEEEEDEEPIAGAPQVFDKDALREKIAKLPIVFGQRDKEVATPESLRDLQAVTEGENYRFPGLDLLEDPEENFTAKLEEHVREQATALESAMRQYKIDGEVVGIESGPVITLYDVRLAPGTKVAQVQAVSSDIARALRAVNIRIVANQVGRDTVGIEVPNAAKEKVRLKELMSQTERFSKMKLPMFLGKDASGEPLIEDLTKMPHMLIAGTTGSGKSVCMNTIIIGFLYTKKPSELKLVLVDPKMVEMSQFKDIPHLMCPVVTEMTKAAAILEWACGKMDERYELLAEAGCRDIAAYNELTWEELKERLNVTTPEEEARIPRKLPYMVYIIDELADMMMTNKEVEGSIIRIAQKARAVGIHLILATQRPQANVVTGLIKSNMPSRVTFKVNSGMDSRIVLDQKGGELLLGQGDMLFLSPSSHKLSRAQGTLVDDREIRRVVKFMREVATPSFERQLVTLRGGDSPDEEKIADSQNNSSASLQAAQEDPMFNRAVEIVLETRRGSVSLLQRRLAIGYTRASRLVDLMGIAGIISDHKGSVARDVLITLEEWEAMKRLATEEANSKGLRVPGVNAEAVEEPSAEDEAFDEDAIEPDDAENAASRP